MAVITRRIGNSIEIRYVDAPIFHPDQARHVLTAQARAFFELALQHLAGHISDEAPIGVSGNLAQSFGGSTGDGGTEVRGNTLDSLEGRVFSSLPYAIVIDQGRTPGATMPPPQALETWIQRVLNFGGSQEELESLAFVVARAIGRKGIRGRQFIAAGVAKWAPDAEAIFARMGDAIASGLVTPAGQGGVTPGAGGAGI